MKQKGVYAATLGFLALVLIMASYNFIQSQQFTEKTETHTEKFYELSNFHQKMRYVLDKTAADAASDYAIEKVDGSCSSLTHVHADLENKITDYFSLSEGLLEGMKGNDLDCTIKKNTITAPNATPLKIDIEFDLNCSFVQEVSALERQTTWFSDKIQFRKEVSWADTGGGDCQITVTDKQSNKIEVQLSVATAAPPAPTNVEVSRADTEIGELKVLWTFVGEAAYYEIVRTTSNVDPNNPALNPTYTPVSGISAGGGWLYYMDSGLTPGIRYYYSVRACSAGGSCSNWFSPMQSRVPCKRGGCPGADICKNRRGQCPIIPMPG